MVLKTDAEQDVLGVKQAARRAITQPVGTVVEAGQRIIGARHPVADPVALGVTAGTYTIKKPKLVGRGAGQRLGLPQWVATDGRVGDDQAAVQNITVELASAPGTRGTEVQTQHFPCSIFNDNLAEVVFPKRWEGNGTEDILVKACNHENSRKWQGRPIGSARKEV